LNFPVPPSKLIESLNLLLKHGEDSIRRVATLKLGAERVRGNVFPRLLAVLDQGSVKDWFKGKSCIRWHNWWH